MELPPTLRSAIDDLVSGHTPGELKRAGERLSERYRAETRDGHLHLADDLAARAYTAARMPATFAAIAAAMREVAAAHPQFSPASLLDVGAGPGTALWAANELWPIEQAVLLEASDPIRRVAERLARGAFAFSPRYVAGDAARLPADAEPADLVTLAYVLDELAPEALPGLVDDLWAATGDTLLVVEPGTPAGWRRILAVRDRLLGAGAHLLAPCPHAERCAVTAPDWCHFARRLPRSRLHRTIKGGEAPFEDEKFSYVAVSRRPPASPAAARVLAPPRGSSGRVALKLCRSDGSLAETLLTRRDGAAFKQARRAAWGDAVE